MLSEKRWNAALAKQVAPSENETRLLTRDAARTRLLRAAKEAADAFRTAGTNAATPRMTHAYFGPLSTYTALRLLTAHTPHHARALARKAR